MKAPLAGVCSKCNAELREGKSALYDDYRDQHFCNLTCFNEWYTDNVEMLAHEYYMLNVEKVQL